MVYAFGSLGSAAHWTETVLGCVLTSLHRLVMFRGPGGRRGSVPAGAGRGLGRGWTFPFTLTIKDLGNASVCSQDISDNEKRSCTCCLYSMRLFTIFFELDINLLCDGVR